MKYGLVHKSDINTMGKGYWRAECVARDATIARVIAEKDAHISRVIAEKDAYISQVVAQKDAHIQALTAESSGKDVRIQALTDALREKEAQLEEATAEKEEVHRSALLPIVVDILGGRYVFHVDDSFKKATFQHLSLEGFEEGEVDCVVSVTTRQAVFFMPSGVPIIGTF